MNVRLCIGPIAAYSSLALLVACGEKPIEGGAEVMRFEGGALDGSEDAALEQSLELEAASAVPGAPEEPEDVIEGEPEKGAGPEPDPALEALAASYLTLPIDELLASMGLARDEVTQMMDLPDETIRQLAIARLRQDALDPDAGGAPERLKDGRLSIRFRHLSLDALDDFEFEAVMDDLMEGEVRFPEQVAAIDGKPVEITGYMIPVEWQRREVTEFMLVRDLLACCFGGAPQPDEWVHVSMEEGKGSPYFPFVPVSVEGTLQIEGIDDGSGYAAGCFRLSGTAAREVR